MTAFDKYFCFLMMGTICVIAVTLIACFFMTFIAMMEYLRHESINVAKRRGVGKTGVVVVTVVSWGIYLTAGLAFVPAIILAYLWPPARWFSKGSPAARRPVKPAAKMPDPTPRSPFPPLSASSRRFLQGGRR